MEIIIQLIAGAIGGTGAGAALKNLSLGTAGNAIAGAVGGIGGGQLLGMLTGGGATEAVAAAAEAAGGADGIGAILTDVAGGGVGGGIVMAVVGVVKNMIGGTNA
ncbi:MAG: hypothetical protein HLUCCA08_14770 [Rhodobacteraceae bacterium HLUCCA08]|nr:MAG: hypothetical protein HLUCCA08_14770 [Rhodobacteraceae bacterium HLUCCA08]